MLPARSALVLGAVALLAVAVRRTPDRGVLA
jgi:hypothetical protein